MKNTLVASAALLLGTLGAHATIYNDATDETPNAPGYFMDISSVEVTNDATNLIFTINIADGTLFAATDWARFNVGFDTVAAVGSTTNNVWNATYIMSEGMDFYVAGWVDSATPVYGVNVHEYTGTTWNETPVEATMGVAIDAASISFTVALLSVGLSVNDTFSFDVYTGSDSDAVDALSSGTLPNGWGQAADTSTNALQYTVVAVPEPSTYAFFAGFLGLIAVMVRRKKA